MSTTEIDSQTAAAALTFQAQPFPTVYLHPGRIADIFTGLYGNPTDVQHSSGRTSSGTGGVNAVIASLETQVEIGRGTTVTFNTQDPLTQAHLVRARLFQDESLVTPVAAPLLATVIASGRGQILIPDRDEADHLRRWKKPLSHWLPSNVVTEFLHEHEERATFQRPDDPTPAYSPAVSLSPSGPVLALLGDNELLWTSWVSHRKTPAICHILGRKSEEFDAWILVEPAHVWLEPQTT